MCDTTCIRFSSYNCSLFCKHFFKKNHPLTGKKSGERPLYAYLILHREGRLTEQALRDGEGNSEFRVWRKEQQKCVRNGFARVILYTHRREVVPESQDVVEPSPVQGEGDGQEQEAGGG